MSASLTSIIMPKRPKILTAGKEFVTSFLTRQAPVELTTLGNGLRVGTQAVSGASSACVSLQTRSGSRFETVQTNGAAHLMQQALWKGTASKTADQIRAQLDAIGGGLELKSGREIQSMSIYCHKDDAPAAVALLGEVAQQGSLDEAAVDAARPCAVEAMKEFEDDLSGTVLNNMHRSCYDTTDATAGSGLGLFPLGTGDNVKSGLDSATLAAFRDQYLTNAATAAVVATGGIDTGAVLNAAEAAFGGMANKGEPTTGKRYIGGALRLGQGVPRAPYANHVACGWEICGASSADNVPLQVMMEYFGSYDRMQHDLNSNMGIRGIYERQQDQIGLGSLHEVRPLMANYSDTGLQGFYYVYSVGATREEGIFFLSRLQFEWVQYCMRLEQYQVEVGKNKLKSKLLFETDGAKKAAEKIGEQILYVGRCAPLEEQYARIDALTVQDISDAVNHYYYDREPVMSSWGIYYTLPDWYAARRGMSKWRY
eukprot:TRINITY_DN3_c0_g2_i1.p1 TRINITY_DN3_c0_g2~~TRINITY_DN3_c0_g2_i1.p1  ORF type:complete len:483 (+),score=177.26 TRINITY_DN3_c0_g2_i1:76-1524(+)